MKLLVVLAILISVSVALPASNVSTFSIKLVDIVQKMEKYSNEELLHKCERGKKIALLCHKWCWAMQGMSEGVQFY